MSALRGGAVPLPRWILIARGSQLALAILALCLTAYPLSIRSGGPLEPPLIATLTVSILTIFPILLLTTPLHYIQRKIYDPRISLLVDTFGTLFWLVAFVTLASYEDLFQRYGKDARYLGSYGAKQCIACRGTWKAGAAACVFAALEFLLFLFTTSIFAYYYHCHFTNAPTYPSVHVNKPEDDTMTSTTAPSTTNDIPITHLPYEDPSIAMYPQLTIAAQHMRETYAHVGCSGDMHHDLPYPIMSPRPGPPYAPSPLREVVESGYGEKSESPKRMAGGYGDEILR